MAPNLLVMAQTAVKPHRWFKSTQSSIPLNRAEVWQEPLPGVYVHTPGCGWSLVAVQDGRTEGFRELAQPQRVVYCKCLHQYLFEEEFQARKRRGYFQDALLRKEPVSFFCIDEGITWVQCFDDEDNFIPGPYERFVLDADTGKFRPMLKCDDPNRRRGSGGSSSSRASSLHCSSRSNSASASRTNSPDRRESRRTGKHASSSTLQVPDESDARSSKKSSPASSRPSSRARRVREEELPRI